MKTKWMPPDTITGDAATEMRYLRRPLINDYFWREVRKGNHILFVAPRRVGKTSIMKDLAESCPEEFACIYRNIESVKSKNEFYQCLFELILYCIHRSKIKEATTFIKEFFKKHCITEISKSGIKMESRLLDYEKELKDLIPELKNAKIHTVIFIDEFAEVIHKLYRNGNVEDAVDILHLLREIRSDKDFEHFTLVYAGSIGMEFVIKKVDRPKLINDLHHISIDPLTGPEATLLIRQLTKKATIRFSVEMEEYLKEKVHYLLPYYLQLMIEEIDLVAYEEQTPDVTIEIVNDAFQRVLGKRKNFEDWLERLKDYQKECFPFLNDILKHVAHNGKITIHEIYDKACNPKYNRSEDYMEFIQQLQQDGYLEQIGEQEYRFVSPFLHQFWLKQYPIYA